MAGQGRGGSLSLQWQAEGSHECQWDRRSTWDSNSLCKHPPQPIMGSALIGVVGSISTTASFVFKGFQNPGIAQIRFQQCCRWFQIVPRKRQDRDLVDLQFMRSCEWIGKVAEFAQN